MEFEALKGEKCPAAFYQELIAEGGVAKDPITGNFVVTRYDLIRKVASDPTTFSSNSGLTIERDTPIRQTVHDMYVARAWPPKHVLLTNDPPEHRLFRALVDRVWSPSRVASIQPYIDALIEESLTKFIQNGGGDFIGDFAATFPVLIAIDFLGLPRTDARQVLAWTEAATSIIDTRFDEARELRAHEQIIDMLNYIREAAARKEVMRDSTFLSSLQQVEIEGRKLTEQELVWLVELLLVGGHDSITLAIGSGMMRLIEEAGLAAALAEDLDRVDNFVEELLRADGPVKLMFRRAVQDAEIGGMKIPAGSIIQLQAVAAGRDPSRFEDPDKFDIYRRSARGHLSFGSGIHMCIGNQLARAEIKSAFRSVLRRMRNFRYAGTPEDVVLKTDYVQQGPKKLNLAFDRIEEL